MQKARKPKACLNKPGVRKYTHTEKYYLNFSLKDWNKKKKYFGDWISVVQGRSKNYGFILTIY